MHTERNNRWRQKSLQTALVSHTWAAALLVIFMTLTGGAAATAQTGGEGSRSSGNETGFFPSASRFSPLIADMKEPGFYGGFRSVDFGGPAQPGGGQQVITAAVVALGGHFEVWGLNPGTGPDGFTVGLFTGVFSQFNLDVPTSDLINTDYLVGPELTARKGRWSGRLRVFHQSSHLGDELLANNPAVERQTISFEVVDLLVAADWDLGPVQGRVYGGGGRVVSSANAFPPGLLQWGFEIRGDLLARPAGSALTPLAAVDVRSFEVQDWGPTVSAKAGLEWLRGPSGPGLRVLGVYLDGFLPFGQFFTSTRLRNAGVEIQLIP